MRPIFVIFGALLFIAGMWAMAVDAFLHGGVGPGVLVAGTCALITAFALDMFVEWWRG